MTIGEPKMLTPEEQAEIQKERLKNDAKLVEEGADMTPDGKITPTDDQIKDAKIEMGEHFYKEGQGLKKENQKLEEKVEEEKETNEDKLKWQEDKHQKDLEKQRELISKFRGNEEVNGFKIMVDWIEGENDIKGPGSIESGNYYEIYFPQIEDTSNQAIAISAEDTTAKEVFDYAMKLAETETDINELGKKVKEHIGTLK